MDENSIDLIITDPPYFKVKNEWWDRQWDNADKFIEWIGLLCEQWYRILKPNGSLYVFASPKMAARVEIEIGKTFNVLNHLIWIKEDNGIRRHASQIIEKNLARSYFPDNERILFADHYNSDNVAKGESGYGKKCDELRGFVFESLKNKFEYMWNKSGLSRLEVDTACNTSNVAQYWFSERNYQIPTVEKYRILQNLSSAFNIEYEDLKREYEDLKREYEDLRRPFNATSKTQYTDVWTFPTVRHFKGRHPCEKPIELIEHIIRMSSNPDAITLDCFMGRGTTLEAARNLNREAIGIEISEKWCRATEQRLSQLRMDIL